MPSITTFAEYSIDPTTGTVAGPDADVHIEPKNMDVLLVLLKAKGELVSREEILQQVWPNQQISDDVINTAISMLRKALAQSGPSNKYLKTVPRKGYRLVYPQSDNVMELHPHIKNKAQQTINAPFVKPVQSENTQASNIDVLTPQYKANQSGLSVASQQNSANLDVNNNRKSTLPSKNRWFIGLLAFFLLLIAAQFSYKSWQQQQLGNTLLILHKQQKLSYDSFIIQAKRRNELVTMIESRLAIRRSEQFEKFFAKFHPQMSREELFVFDQIRGITSGTLLSANSSMLKLLDDNPNLTSQLPLAVDLHKHLAFWINKYHNVFALRNDMCLLYVGVEDGVPYPSKLDKQVRQWLEQRELI